MPRRWACAEPRSFHGERKARRVSDPSNTFAAIAADPPWHEPGGCGRGADDHYDTIKDRSDILRAMVTAPCWRPAANAHLYLWTTMTSLLDGLWVVDALGFRYVTHAMWVKTKAPDLASAAEVEPDMGLGQYFRGSHEVVLFGVRGKGFAVRSEDKSIPSWFAAPVPRERGGEGKKIHSRKPDKFYEIVERRTIGARLEMFSRVARPGWEIWGDEAPAQPAEVAP